jgi:photosystem II stability/assembly factor-like uncharacterized protein
MPAYNIATVIKLIKTLIVAMLMSPIAFAHVPHDVVSDSVISPNIQTDASVYSIVRGNLLKSTDRGNTWQRLVKGLDNKALFQAIAIAPKNSQNLYVSSDGDGIYTSDDAGLSWRKQNQGLDTLNLNKLYTPPTEIANTVFATGTKTGVYKFNSSNNSWSKIYNGSVGVTAISGLNWEASSTASILIGNKAGTVFISKDGSNVWKLLYKFSNCGEINTIATSNNSLSANIFFVGTSKCGIFRTTDSGQSFTSVNTGITDLNIRSIALSPAYDFDTTVFVSTRSQAIFLSHDGGLTWAKNSDNITKTEQADKLKTPHFRNIAISADFKNDKTLFLSGFNGLFRSTDAGIHWAEVTTVPVTLIQALALSPAYATDSTVAITTYHNGAYKSVNSSSNWQKIADNVAARNFDIAFSPNFSADGIIFTTTSFGKNNFAKSTDRGVTWSSVQISSLKDDPTLITFSPAFANDKTVFLGTRDGGIYRSTDQGGHFSLVFNELFPHCNACIASLVTSPNYAKDHTLFAATQTGLHVSHDAGSTWQLKTDTYHLFADKKGNHVKLAISPNYLLDRRIFIASLDGLFLTTNEFSTWRKVSAIDGNITALAISPNYKNDQTVIITVKGRGLFKSEDGGLSFQALSPALIDANYSFELWDGFPYVSSAIISFSPNYAIDKTIFAIDANNVNQSQDGGKTWTTVFTNY